MAYPAPGALKKLLLVVADVAIVALLIVMELSGFASCTQVKEASIIPSETCVSPFLSLKLW